MESPGPAGVGHAFDDLLRSRMPQDALRDIELLMRARHGLLHLETEEESRAGTLLAHVADGMEVPLYTWSRSRGLRRADLEDPIYDLSLIHISEPTRQLASSRMPSSA